MEKPENLFPETEWRGGDGVLHWHNKETEEHGVGDMWKTWVGPFCCEIDVIPEVVYARIFRHGAHKCSDIPEAVSWLRQKLREYRDELIRVTGDG